MPLDQSERLPEDLLGVRAEMLHVTVFPPSSV